MEVQKSALVGHSAEEMFDLIEAAEHYPAFLPWCAAATILERSDAVVVARIGIDYHGVRFSLVTRNPKHRPEWMAIDLEQGPFSRFHGNWRVTPLTDAGCKVEFSLGYDFSTATFGRLAGPVFDRIANTLVDAFVARADVVFPRARSTGPEAAVPAKDQST